MTVALVSELRSLLQRTWPRALRRPASAPVVLAGALVHDRDGRVLLLHRATPGMTWWEVPGGKVEPGEQSWDAAARELSEELGAHIENIGEVGTAEFDSNGQRLRYTWFVARLASGYPHVVERDRFDDCRFFTPEEVETLADPSPSLRCLLDSHSDQLRRLLRYGTDVGGPPARHASPMATQDRPSVAPTFR